MNGLIKSISQTYLIAFSLLVSSLTFAESPDVPEFNSRNEIRLLSDAPTISEISFSVIVFNEVGWTENEVNRIIDEANQIYLQECRVSFNVRSIEFATVDGRLHDLTHELQEELLMELSDRPRPIVFFIEKTSEADFAYAYIEGTASPSQGTVWLTRESASECRGSMLAHELGHIALEQKIHSDENNNLMNRSCRHSNVKGQFINTQLNSKQCEVLWRKYGQY